MTLCLYFCLFYQVWITVSCLCSHRRVHVCSSSYLPSFFSFFPSLSLAAVWPPGVCTFKPFTLLFLLCCSTLLFPYNITAPHPSFFFFPAHPRSPQIPPTPHQPNHHLNLIVCSHHIKTLATECHWEHMAVEGTGGKEGFR